MIIDKKVCIGCGTCVAIAPKSFRFDKNNKVEVIDLPAGKAGPVGDNEKTVKEAIDSCPVNAIQLRE